MPSPLVKLLLKIFLNWGFLDHECIVWPLKRSQQSVAQDLYRTGLETIYSFLLDLSQFWDIHFAPTRGSLCKNETHTEESVAIGEGVGERERQGEYFHGISWGSEQNPQKLALNELFNCVNNLLFFLYKLMSVWVGFPVISNP